jgi:stage II sporulation protein AA (anti-sigma F factor antagonist)
VRVAGELCLASAPYLELALRRAKARASDLVMVDLDRVTFIDVSGMRVLMAAAKRVREAGGELMLMRVPLVVQRLLELTGVDKTLL